MGAKLIDAQLVIALVGIIGVVAGAWLNSRLSSAQQRWNLRRELYERLLVNLGEARYALDGLYESETSGQPYGGNEEAWERWREWRKGLFAHEHKAETEIRRATSTAAIILSGSAFDALRQLEKDWRAAQEKGNPFEMIDERLAGVNKAFDAIVTAARKDLRIRA